LEYQYPIVVHCSAGVGRTGTYITLDAMIEKVDTEGRIDIFKFVSRIRERRQYLVQTSKQYIFIHEALNEYCTYGFTDVEASNLLNHYNQLRKVPPLATNNVNNSLTLPFKSVLRSPHSSHPLSKKTRLQLEFEKLSNSFAANSQAREAFMYENKIRNRYLNSVCYDYNRIVLSSLNGSNYINGTKLKGFDFFPNEFIITQDPLPHTVFEFWKMVVEYDCKIIVSLNRDFQMEVESVYWPTKDSPVRISECEDIKFVIRLLDTQTFLDNSIIKREFEITEHAHSSSTKTVITHFVYNESWPENELPKDRSHFLDLVSKVQKLGEKNERSTVIVHSHGGASNCSVFCAINILIYQFKNDQTVDVCRTVKQIKSQRMNMIQTFEHYEFLYESIVDIGNMIGIYNAQSMSDSFNNNSHNSINTSFN
jgi:protein tyrosine phosphatase